MLGLINFIKILLCVVLETLSLVSLFLLSVNVLWIYVKTLFSLDTSSKNFIPAISMTLVIIEDVIFSCALTTRLLNVNIVFGKNLNEVESGTIMIIIGLSYLITLSLACVLRRLYEENKDNGASIISHFSSFFNLITAFSVPMINTVKTIKSDSRHLVHKIKNKGKEFAIDEVDFYTELTGKVFYKDDLDQNDIKMLTRINEDLIPKYLKAKELYKELCLVDEKKRHGDEKQRLEKDIKTLRTKIKEESSSLMDNVRERRSQKVIFKIDKLEKTL